MRAKHICAVLLLLLGTEAEALFRHAQGTKIGSRSPSHGNLPHLIPMELQAKELEAWSRTPLKAKTTERDLEQVTGNTGSDALAVSENFPFGSMLDLMRIAGGDPVLSVHNMDLELMGRLGTTRTEDDIARNLFISALNTGETQSTLGGDDLLIDCDQTVPAKCASPVPTQLSKLSGFTAISLDFYLQMQGISCTTTHDLVTFNKNPGSVLRSVLPKDIRRVRAYGVGQHIVFQVALVPHDGKCQIEYSTDAIGRDVQAGQQLRHSLRVPIAPVPTSVDGWTRVQIVHQGSDVHIYINGISAGHQQFPLLEYFGASSFHFGKTQPAPVLFRLFSSARAPTQTAELEEDSTSFCEAQFEEHSARYEEKPSMSFQAVATSTNSIADKSQSGHYQQALMKCCFDPACSSFSVEQHMVDSDHSQYISYIDIVAEGSHPKQTTQEASSSFKFFKKIDSKFEASPVSKLELSYGSQSLEQDLEMPRLKLDSFMNLIDILHISSFPPTEALAQAVEKYVDFAGGVPLASITVSTGADKMLNVLKQSLQSEKKGDIASKTVQMVSKQVVSRMSNFNVRWNFEECSASGAVTPSTPCRAPVDGLVDVGIISVCDFVRNELFERNLLSLEAVARARSAIRDYMRAWKSKHHVVGLWKGKKWVDLPRAWVHEKLASSVLSGRVSQLPASDAAKRKILDALVDIVDFDVLLGLDTTRAHLSECEWSLLYAYVLDEKRDVLNAELDLVNLFHLLETADYLSSSPSESELDLAEATSGAGQGLSLQYFRHLIKIINVGKSVLVSKCKHPSKIGVCKGDDELEFTYAIGQLLRNQEKEHHRGAQLFAENLFRSLAHERDRTKPLNEITIDRKQLVRYFVRLMGSGAVSGVDKAIQDASSLDDTVLTWDKFWRVFSVPSELFIGIEDEEITSAIRELETVWVNKEAYKSYSRFWDSGLFVPNGNVFSVFMVGAVAFRNALCDRNTAECVEAESARDAHRRTLSSTLSEMHLPQRWQQEASNEASQSHQAYTFPRWLRFFADQVVDSDFTYNGLKTTPKVLQVVVGRSSREVLIYVETTEPISDLAATSFHIGHSSPSLLQAVNAFEDDLEPEFAPLSLSSSPRRRSNIKPCAVQYVVPQSENSATSLNLCGYSDKDNDKDCVSRDKMCVATASTEPSTHWLVTVPNPISLGDKQVELSGELRFRFAFAFCPASSTSCVQGLPFDEKFVAVRLEAERHADGLLYASQGSLPYKVA